MAAEPPGVPEQGPPAEHKCPACAAALKRRGKYGFLATDNPTDVHCGSCLRSIMPSLSALRSWEGGFGTDAIRAKHAQASGGLAAADAGQSRIHAVE